MSFSSPDPITCRWCFGAGIGDFWPTATVQLLKTAPENVVEASWLVVVAELRSFALFTIGSIASLAPERWLIKKDIFFVVPDWDCWIAVDWFQIFMSWQLRYVEEVHVFVPQRSNHRTASWVVGALSFQFCRYSHCFHEATQWLCSKRPLILAMAIVGRAKYTHAHAKFRGGATRRERLWWPRTAKIKIPLS